ncbi:serine/threonine-protein kinase [Bifidobacterium avesanii]|uniref:non-specific serine/threonine protein kinase n=1 Tax=Bifidobacterium avesanii TaxID=1798157 RepID=A0A7K3THG1_9BIFI|nr:serine/threonine-protein kinase [Bifidobacterium avesanii]KAB8292635.1 kinase [Bifidobacterium avesanii]NEG78537.1 protein kinase [Bifidobacterium avesanii]
MDDAIAVLASGGYAPLRRLGVGTTAEVWLCRHVPSGREVAVKLARRRADDEEARRFLAEAEVLSELSAHPSILTVLGAGVAADGRPYLALEFAPGGNGRQLMAGSPLGPAEALDVGVRLSGALLAAHRLGVTHRDVKPANILFAADGSPLLADFGVAASVYDVAVATGHSEPWAAPEVLGGRSGGDESTDLYSLAASLFALMTGRPPRDAEDVRGEPTVPPAVSRALAPALSANPADRPYSALEFARGLQTAQWLAFGGVTPLVADGEPAYPPRIAARLEMRVPPGSALRTGSVSPDHPASRSSRRSPSWTRAVAISTAVAALLALGAGVAVPAVLRRVDSVPAGVTVEAPGPSVPPSDSPVPLPLKDTPGESAAS